MTRIIFVVLFFCPLALFAQKDFRLGYIVLNSGDTLQGYVLYQRASKISDKCYYRQSPKGESKTYTADDVQSYVISREKYYASVYLDSAKKAKAFVEKLLTGRVSIYRYQNNFYAEKDKIYPLENKVGVVNDQNVKYEHDYKRFAGMLNYLFLDCQSMGGLAFNANLNEKSLVDMATRYSKCWQVPYVDYKQFKPHQVINYYAFAGITSTTLSFTSVQYAFITVPRTHMSSVVPSFGIGIQMRQPRSLENIALSAELIFSNHKFHEFAVTRSNSQDVAEDINMQYSRIRIPLSLKYQFSTTSSSPYIRFGYLMNVYFGGNLDVVQVKTNVNDPSIETKRREAYDIGNLPMGQFWGAFGFQKRIGKVHAFAELRAEVIGGKGNAGVKQVDGEAVVIDAKSVTSTTLNGFVGVIF